MDPIADMLTIIRNGQAAKKKTVSIPYSKIKMNIVEVLSKNGFIGEVSKKGKRIRRIISVELKYDEDGAPAIKHLKRVSKLSRRLYSKAKDAMPVQKGHGMRIFTTPKGILTDEEVRKQKVGGEVICEVY